MAIKQAIKQALSGVKAELKSVAEDRKYSLDELKLIQNELSDIDQREREQKALIEQIPGIAAKIEPILNAKTADQVRDIVVAAGVKNAIVGDVKKCAMAKYIQGIFPDAESFAGGGGVHIGNVSLETDAINEFIAKFDGAHYPELIKAEVKTAKKKTAKKKTKK